MNKKGFTLVELLAVIAVLGLILIIAVPKITNTMEKSRKKTLELAVKSLARSAEEQYIENGAFGIGEVNCESISDYSNDDFLACNISFDEVGEATVILIGKGKYKNLYVCNGTKTNALVTEEVDEECEEFVNKVFGPVITINNSISENMNKPTALSSITFDISGKVEDDDEIQTLKINNEEITINNDGTWSTSITITANVLTEIEIKGTDEKGYTTAKKVYVVKATNLTVTADNREKVGYTGVEGEELEIPDLFYDEIDGKWYKVTIIGDKAFQNCTNLKSVVLPDGVTALKTDAFSGCTNLESIHVPDSLTSLGARTFYNCTSLETFIMPDNVTSLGSDLFKACSSLKNVKLSNNLTTISGTFNGCSSLESVIIPYGVTEIGANTFSSCTSLKDITIPSTVKGIWTNAFAYCTSLENITIPESVVEIGKQAFLNCTNLKKVTLSEGLESIGYRGFEGCTSLETITIPSTVTYISDWAFRKDLNLKNVAFANPNGWWVADTADATSGTSIEITNGESAATLLKTTYVNYYWNHSVE